MFSKKQGGSLPSCFGRESHYRSSDYHCRNCPDQRECVAEINRSPSFGRRPSVRVPVRESVQDVGVESSATEAGNVREGETPFGRFLKDCATGACRGWSFEQYMFFRNFRF